MESLGAGIYRRREGPADAVRLVLERLSREQNELLGNDMVGDDGRLRMENFSREQGGHLSAEQVSECEQRVQEREISWSPLMNEQSREFHMQKYGLTEAGRDRQEVDAELLARWRTEREVSDTALTEVAVTASLARALKGEFTVVRSSAYDDYEHGVDQLIVHRGTGEVVAAFDEVTESASAARHAGKQEKIMKLARGGGTQVTFGIGYSEGQVVRRSFRGVPVFALAVAKGEAREVLLDIAARLDAEPGDKEAEFVSKLLNALREQQHRLLSDQGVPEEMRQTLASFGKVLEKASLGRAQRAAA